MKGAKDMFIGKKLNTEAAVTKKTTKKKAPVKKEETLEKQDLVEIGSKLTAEETGKAKQKDHEKDTKDAKGAIPETPEKAKKPPAEKKEGTVNLKFIHMNDVHGYGVEFDKPAEFGIVGGLDRTAGEVKRLKAENPEATVIVDGGDSFDGGFFSKFTEGSIVSQAFKEMGVEASIIGNHDLTWGLEKYANLAKDTGATMLGANVVDISTGQHLNFLKPYTVMEKNGVKIGIVGVTTPMTKLGHGDDVEIEDPRRSALRNINKMNEAEKPDMIVILSHLGVEEDKVLAEKLAKDGVKVDLIVGSHSHTAVEEPIDVAGTKIVQAGGDGKYLGNLDIQFDPKSKKIVSAEENLIKLTKDIKPDPVVKKILQPFIDKYTELKDKKLGEAPENLPQSRDKTTKLCNLFVEAQKMDSDVAVTSSFSIRSGIDKGDITYGDLFTMYPFDNELLQVKGKGSDIIGFLEGGLRFVKDETGEKPLDEAVKDKDNYALVAGMDYDWNPHLVDGSKITSVTFKGKKYSREDFAKKRITISMDNYTLGKSYFKHLKDGDKVVQKLGNVFECLEKYIKETDLSELQDGSAGKVTSDVPDENLLADVKYGTIKKKEFSDPPTEDKFTCASKFYADTIKEATGADLAFGYNKSIRSRLPEGEVTQADLHDMCPFTDELYKVETSGGKVIAFLEYAREDRNKGREAITSSGLTYEYDSSLPEGERVVSVTFKDKKYSKKQFLQLQNIPVAIDSSLFKDPKTGEEGKFYKPKTEPENFGSLSAVLGEHIKKNSPLEIIGTECPGKDLNPKAGEKPDPEKIWERKQTILKAGKGMIKPEEVNQFTLNKIRLLTEPTKAFDEQIKIVQNTKDHLGVTMYTLTHPKMIDALTDKAQENSGKIPVRVVMDAHIHAPPEKLLERKEAQDKMIKGGVRFLEDPGDHIFCNHSKTLNSDGKAGAVSKVNWADYSENSHDYAAIIDEGPAVNDVENFFNRTWHMAGGKPLENSPAVPDVEGGIPVKTSFTNPDAKSYKTPYFTMKKNIEGASKTIWGQYFNLTAPQVVSNLIAAKQADPEKDIRILLNAPIFLEQASAQKQAQKLMDAGIQVRLFKDAENPDKFLHAATTVYDGKEVDVGSANTTFGGLFSNREANVDVVPGEGNVIDAQFKHDWEHNSREITPDDMKLAEADEPKAPPFYDTPMEHIAKTLGIGEAKLQKSIDDIKDATGNADLTDFQALEVKLIAQKLASYSPNDEGAFDRAMDRFMKMLTVEVDDTFVSEKPGEIKEKACNDARETLGNYIMLHNIAINNPDKDQEKLMDELTDNFVNLFKEMNDGKVLDDTMEVRSAFVTKYGVA